MGNRSGRQSPQEQLKQRTINKQQHIKEDEQIAKLVMLGIGEGGKTTLFRQMHLVHGQGLTRETRTTYKAAIHEKVIVDVQHLLKENAEHKEDEEFRLSVSSAALAEKLLKVSRTDNLTPQIGEWLHELWSDPGFRHTFERRKTIDVAESTSYFLGKIDLLVKEDYLLEDDDILRMRVRTTGLLKDNFAIDKLKIVLCTGGSQRNERRKWPGMFEGVTAVLYVVAISEYDQFLWEDESTLRTTESLEVFDHLVAQYFPSTPIILILTKKDLFDQKFLKVPLKDYFPDFTGDRVEEGYEFLKQMYRSRLPHNKFHCYVMTAIDSSDFKRVFQEIQKVVNKIQMEDHSLL
eukprot:TRINITY_DN23082_c0_g1_i9.p1 TRINITY_DN23082_c0_g1~~TRINITY_DN23082_c0_g1_i9.p1  ORF type:complete len:358 (-),score=85.82 TRINITY_DN23082_c0_g1_i9:111-1154(-)